MKTITYFLVMFMLATASHAQEKKARAILNINRIEIDGYDDDIIWDYVGACLLDRNFIGDSIPTIGGSYFKISISMDYIYIFLFVDDNEYLPAWKANDENPFMWDMPVLYFDVNNKRKDGLGAFHENSGHFIFAAPIDSGMYDTKQYSTILGDTIEYCYAVPYHTETYSIEYKIPFSVFTDSIGNKLDFCSFVCLEEGLGFDITIYDRDSNDSIPKRKVWSNDGSKTDESFYCMDESGMIFYLYDDICKCNNNQNNTRLIEDISKSIFPNPASSQLMVDYNYDMVIIRNLQGQQVINIQTKKPIDISTLKNGMYLVESFLSGHLNGAGKFIKN
ncbi:MAG TPA: T9SS type A sorting domain-containing protein [Prolixibacteraceae bacterium]|nr:T9SS type A sorting domain-containing protein [Prolixibacteraceae bacterium]